MIPSYLSTIANRIDEKRHTIYFSLICSCGNCNFSVFNNKNTKSEKNNSFDNYWRSLKVPVVSINSAIDRESGEQYFYGKTLFGIHVGKFFVKDVPVTSDIQLIKIKCSKCGKEHIIFDSRQYGYDGVIEENRSLDYNDIEFSQIKIKAFFQPVEISVKIINDLIYQEFIDSVGDGFNQDDYSNAFSSIDIYAIKNGKKVRIFSSETA